MDRSGVLMEYEIVGWVILNEVIGLEDGHLGMGLGGILGRSLVPQMDKELFNVCGWRRVNYVS